MAVVNQYIQDDVSLLYTAFFGRAPEATGYTYWVQQMANTTGTSTQSGAASAAQNLAKSFALVPEFATTYGSLTPSQQIDTLYTNILNRPADAAGKAYWLNEMNNGTAFSTVAWQVVYACFLGGSTVDPADAALVQNKVAVAEYLAGTLACNDLTIAQSAFAEVTSDPACVATVEASLLVAAANQIDITTIVPGTFTGASGNNTFNALGYLSGTTILPSLVNGDSLIGSANGVNTLNANLFTASITPTALTNIQQLVLSNEGTSSLDVTNSNAITNVQAKNLVGNITVANVKSYTDSFQLNNISSTASFTVSGATGATGAVTVELTDVTGGNDLALPDTFTGLNLVSNGTTANNVSTDFDGQNSNGTGGITITGANDLTLSGVANSNLLAVTVNASGFTGDLSTTVSDSVTTTFTGGSGNESVRLIDSTGGIAINMGNGTNVLMVDSFAQVSSEASITGGTGTDTLRFSAVTTGVSADLDSITGGFDTMQLAGGTTTSNVITLGTNFVNAGFTQVLSAGTGDNITVANAALTSGTVFSNSVGTGTGTLTLNTAGGTFTVSNYDNIATSGTVANIITIGGTANTTITSDAGGLQTLNLADAGLHTLTLAGSSTFAVNGSATTGDKVVLGTNDGTTGGATTVTSGAGGLFVDMSASEAANIINFAAGNNTLLVDNLAGVSAAASITGGSGTDTLRFSAVLSTGANADKSLDSITGGFNTLQLAGGTTTSNVITLGTNFVNAGFTQVLSAGTGDNITVANAVLTGQLFANSVGTGTGTLTLNTASGSLTVNDYATINGNGSAVALTLTGDVTSNMGISLFTGSSVTNLNTFTSTITMSGASTYTGNMVNDILTLGSGGAMTINGAGGNDQVTLGANTSNATITTGGNTGTFSVIGSDSIAETLAITNLGTFGLTAVDTVTFGSAVDVNVDVVINTTAGLGVTYNYDLTGSSTADFFLNGVGVGTGGSIALTVDSGVGSTITIADTDWLASASTANVAIDTNGALSTIALSASDNAREHVEANLSLVANSTNTAGAFAVTGFGGDADTINLYGQNLTNAVGQSTYQYQNAASVNGFTNTNTFTLGTTFVTGTSTLVTGSLADLTTAGNAAGLIFYVSDSSSTLTTSFATQAGINTAVSYITSRIGTAGTSATQSAVIAITENNDGGGIDSTALFLFTSDGTAGIVSSELKLVGVVNGALSSASNFS
jgi:hypothetical protein